MKEIFVTQALASRWANELLFAELAKLSEAALREKSEVNFGSILGIANHMILGDRLWLWRFTGQGEQLTSVEGVPWPEFATLRAVRAAEDERVIAFAESLDLACLGELLHFTTTKGEERALPFGACLAHFFNHQTHHRGQLHALLGVHGVKAPDIDLLYYVTGAPKRAR